MGSIVSALEQVKVEFLSSGVRLRSNDIAVLEGDDCYLQLLDDIYHTTKDKIEEVLFIYGDCSTVSEEELQGELRIRKKGVKWRILAEEGNTNLYYPVEDWRWFPKKFFKRNIQLIYGSKIAMGIRLDKSRNLTTKMIVIDSAPLAEATKNLFNFVWESCRKPPFSTAKKIYE